MYGDGAVNSLFVIGRIALVLIFMISGGEKLMDISATATDIAAKVAIPAALSGLAAQISSATGMTIPQLLAIATGVIEVAAALMIAANMGTRVGAFLLILFTLITTFYFHDFWNMVGAARTDNFVHALKNLSIIGGLLVMFVLGSWRPSNAADTLEAGQTRY
jgi:putative oxidoreductase